MIEGKRVSYEEACAVSKRVCTPDAFRRQGIEKVMARYAEALEGTGWTHADLLKEAQQRMHAQIEEMRLSQ